MPRRPQHSTALVWSGRYKADAIHLALWRTLQEDWPAYAPDDGPLSEATLAQLRARAGILLSEASVVSRKTLF